MIVNFKCAEYLKKKIHQGAFLQMAIILLLCALLKLDVIFLFHAVKTNTTHNLVRVPYNLSDKGGHIVNSTNKNRSKKKIER